MADLIITLTNGESDLDLEFDLCDTNIAQRWLREVDLFIAAGQPWDDTQRFYNFPSTPWTEPRVRQRLQDLVDIINDHEPVCEIDLSAEITQDQLNLLHSVFERYHGLYDQQSSNSWFQSAPLLVQQALADLNIWIHRYETLGDIPRFVATWRYKPARQPIMADDFRHFNLVEHWGDLRLNYCEIGKSLFDLWHDQDRYISSEAFRPQHWFAFDFTVRFTTHDPAYYQAQEEAVWRYFRQNIQQFRDMGYDHHDPRLSLGAVTVARLRGNPEQLMPEIDQRQQIKSIRRT